MDTENDAGQDVPNNDAQVVEGKDNDKAESQVGTQALHGQIQKLEEEKSALAEQIQALEAARGVADIERARAEVFLEKNLPVQLREFVQGSTKEEIEALADKLLAALSKAPEPKITPDPLQGGLGDAPLNGDAIENALRAALGAN